jgi:hypothetical protein
MKRSEIRNKERLKLSVAWRQAEYAALQAIDADTCDDRVSEDVFEVEDERAEVDIIVQGMLHGAS